MITSRPLRCALLGCALLAAAAGCSSARAPQHATQAAPAHQVQTLDVGGAPTSAPAAPPTSAPAPAALPDPCKLLTRAEAAKLAGVHMQPGDDTPARDPATDIASCTYDAVFTGPSGHVDVFAQVGIPHALQVDRAIHHKFRTVPGIGDQTLEEPDNESIFIRRGTLWIYVDASNASATQLEHAASLIASRLP